MNWSSLPNLVPKNGLGLLSPRKQIELDELEKILEEPQPRLNENESRTASEAPEGVAASTATSKQPPLESQEEKSTFADVLKNPTVVSATVGAFAGGVIAGPFGAAAGMKGGAACVAASAGVGAVAEMVYTKGQETMQTVFRSKKE